MLAARSVLWCPWLSASGLWPDSPLEPGSRPPAPAGFGAPPLRQEGADDWQVLVWLLCWWTRGRRRLLQEESLGMPELGSSGHVPALDQERAGGSPVDWSAWASSGSCRASGQHRHRHPRASR